MENSIDLYPQVNCKVYKKSIRAGNRLLLWIPFGLSLVLGLLEYYGITSLDDALTLLFFVGIPLVYTAYRLKGDYKTVFKLNGIDKKALIPLMLITLAIQPISTLLYMISAAIFGNHMDMLFQEILTQGPLLLFITLCIIPAIGEEFIMRGIVLHLYNPLKSQAQLIINGFLFGIFHMNLNQFSYSCFIGMVLALAVMITKSIWSGVLIHFLNNFLSYLEFQFNFALINDNISQLSNWIIVVGLSVLSAYVLYRLFSWVNAIYRETTIGTYLSQRDEEWIRQNNCKKLSWSSMWTLAMWVNMFLFMVISVVIILSAKHII